MIMNKKELKQYVVNQYKSQFISFERQRESFPSHIVQSWIFYINREWENGLINYDEFRMMMNVNILKIK